MQEMPFVPTASYRRRILREDGGPSRDFLTYYSEIWLRYAVS